MLLGSAAAILAEKQAEVLRFVEASAGRPRARHDEMLAAALQLGLEIEDAGVNSVEDIEAALREAAQKRASLVAVIDDPVLQGHLEPVVRIATSLKLPVVSQSADYVRGGLHVIRPEPE